MSERDPGMGERTIKGNGIWRLEGIARHFKTMQMYINAHSSIVQIL
jgi:hypothetical protein